MAISTRCPNCKALFRLDDEMAGKKAKCQKCAHVFIVPNSTDNLVAPAASVAGPTEDVQASPQSALEPPPPPMPPLIAVAPPDDAVTADDEPARPSKKSVPPPIGKKTDDDEPRPRPRRAPAEAGSNVAMITMFILLGGGALLICAGLCGGIGWFFYAIDEKKAKPAAIANKGDLKVQAVGVKGGGMGPQPGPPVVPPGPPVAPPPGPPQQPPPKGEAIKVVFGPDGVYTSDNVLSQQDPLILGQRTKLYAVEFEAGKTYQIDLLTRTNGYDPYLYLYDDKNVLVAHDDDSGGFPNARIIFTPVQNGVFRIQATHFGQFNGMANYTLTVRRR